MARRRGQVVGEAHHVYVYSKEHAWVPAELLETSKNGMAKVKVPVFKSEQDIQSGARSRGSQVEQVKLADYPNASLPLQNVDDKHKLLQLEDMVDLPFLHEAAILYNLKSRHVQSLPYTRTGDIVIAVNPYKWLHHLYTEQLRTHYSKTLVWAKSDQDTRKGLAPHVYEVSALAYRGLALEEQNQSILVSGESGAGKTETVKICMNHIASVQRGLVQDGASTYSSPIVQRVLDSNPLLEAFGNAKTTRNDNSSRFGKYIQLQFDGEDPHEASLQGKTMPDCVLAGSKCEVYLLEKSRVVGHDPEERTYHIFYQLLAAPQKQKAEIWEGLKDTNNESFEYVGWTDTTSIEGKTDGQRFQQTLDSLALIGVKDDKLLTLMRSICVVLQLGNIRFAPDPKDSEKSSITSTGEFAMLAKLLGISPNVLIKAFLERTVSARGEQYKVPVSADKAKDSCDALAKEIYARAFLWLVREINEATCAEKNYEGLKRDEYGLIGLLDIFGFESFKVNRFEQLCINYANEKLQQKFTQDIFRTVQEEYEFEGIELEEITYDDNTDVLDLIEGRVGLLAVLNEECFRPNGNDQSFVQKSLQQNKESPCLIVHRTDKMSFGIRHYAGPVVYHSENFVTKNTDTIPSDLKDAVAVSSNDIIAHHLDNDAMMKGPPRRPAAQPIKKRKSSNLVGETVWTKFRTQLNSLNTNLCATRTRYIRCIKPNTLKKPIIMQHQSTVEQLRCAGVVAAVTISRSAFPNRLDHQVVVDRFKSLWPKGKAASEGAFGDEGIMEDVDVLLTSALMERQTRSPNGKIVKAFVIGKSRAYFRAGALEFLETKRMDSMGFWATEIQRIVRGFVGVRRFQKKRRAAVKIQTHGRTLVARTKFLHARSAAIVVQCCIRIHQSHRRVLDKRYFARASKIQTRWRMVRAVRLLQKNREAAIAIQKITRGFIQRPKYIQALQDKKDEKNMSKQLEKMQRKLEEAERQREKDMKMAQERARRELEEERKRMAAERRAMELAAARGVAPSAAAKSVSSSVYEVEEKKEELDPEERRHQEELKRIQAEEFAKQEKERKEKEANIERLRQEKLRLHQAEMQQSTQIIDFLADENNEIKNKLERMKRDFELMKQRKLALQNGGSVTSNSSIPDMIGSGHSTSYSSHDNGKAMAVKEVDISKKSSKSASKGKDKGTTKEKKAKRGLFGRRKAKA